MNLFWTILAGIALFVIGGLPILFIVVALIWHAKEEWHHRWYMKKGRFK